MRDKITVSVTILLVGFFTLSLNAYSQVTQGGAGGVDAVAISGKYYNSIVKILLYDSVAARINPDKAYLGRGSGFFVSKDGYIFTNRHVIEMCYHGFCRYTTYNEEEKKYDENFDMYTPSLLSDPNIFKITYVGRPAIIVQLYTNSKGDSSKLYHAQIVALDTMHFDGAILKINSDINGNPVTDKFHPVPFGNSDSVKQGQDLCLFGFPAQYGGTFEVMLKDLSTLMFGKHSGYDYTYNTAYGFIKTDAAVNSGNSGGPVFGSANTVIGIATAAFEKTNVGLIGGIDAMYDVASLIPDLLKEATANGLTAPSHKQAFSTASLYKPLPLPNAKDIKRSNNRAGKKGLANSKAYLVLAPEYAFSANATATINPSPSSNFSTEAGTTLSIPLTEFGAMVRIVKPTFLKQRNNLVGYFINLEPGVSFSDWTGTAPLAYKGGGVTMEKSDAEPHLFFSFGFSYTYLFSARTCISLYYGPGLDMDPVSGSAKTIGNADSVASPTNSIQYTRPFAAFVQTAGLMFKCRALWVGLDYHFGESFTITYQVPSAFSGPNANNPTNITGNFTRNTVNVVLGFAL